ncbi:hypothetical protein CROQUDRAFT_52896 [Cronartium quercuum f. sp. fusiforme G11]|uniref:PIG-P domain-containing protein n=1 Tax=Cronartium quercuum f. sp. fusiforme G11 TaxID=708437 RepID=A0A9P6N6N0_9BASI|nr:hypothetical protein CROQUDRAFT_52896 [Cronartium quercuum f. sp. fusiforme G11]
MSTTTTTTTTIPTNALTQASFATYVLSWLSYLIYLLWSTIPTDILEQNFKISWYPSPSWSTLIPAWLTISCWFIYIFYISYNIWITPSVDGIDGLKSIIDSSSIIINHFDLLKEDQIDHSEQNDPPVPILRDVPCQIVNEFYF